MIKIEGSHNLSDAGVFFHEFPSTSVSHFSYNKKVNNVNKDSPKQNISDLVWNQNAINNENVAGKVCIAATLYPTKMLCYQTKFEIPNNSILASRYMRINLCVFPTAAQVNATSNNIYIHCCHNTLQCADCFCQQQQQRQRQHVDLHILIKFPNLCADMLPYLPIFDDLMLTTPLTHTHIHQSIHMCGTHACLQRKVAGHFTINARISLLPFACATRLNVATDLNACGTGISHTKRLAFAYLWYVAAAGNTVAGNNNNNNVAIYALNRTVVVLCFDGTATCVRLKCAATDSQRRVHVATSVEHSQRNAALRCRNNRW